jgi:hypothetical protein
MSGKEGIATLKSGIDFLFDSVASGIALFKNRTVIVNEVKDLQVDEIIELLVDDVKTGVGKILDVIKK